MASAWKFRTLSKRNKRANHGRKPCRGRPRSQYKQPN
jgi:hypothetical protein